MAVSQTLTLKEVAGSSSVANNTSQVQILWQSTQTGESWNGYTRTAYYYVSINGGAEKEYTVSYTLPKGTTKTILDTTITVPHKDDGSGTVKVRTWMDTDISAGVVKVEKSLTLATIARASTITSAANVTLGNKCDVRWTPKSAAFTYALVFYIGTWRYGTGVIRPNKTSAYTYTNYVIPMEVARQIVSGYTGTMTVVLYTSDSSGTNQIGDPDTKTFTVTVPKSASPTVTMSLSPVHSLPEAFDDVYVQGISKVKAEFSSVLQYDATLKHYELQVENIGYGANANYTSGHLTTPGINTLVGYVEDSRTYNDTVAEGIEVIPYATPQIKNVSARRCHENGTLSDAGACLQIVATRHYHPVEGGIPRTQRNFCQIRYRYKIEGSSYYSDWATILAGDDLSSDEVVTEPLLVDEFLTTNSYRVEVQAIDDTGNYAAAEVIVPTDKVYWHRDGARNALGLGKYNEEDNALDSAWDFYMNGHKITELADPEGDTDAVTLGFLKQYIDSRLAKLTSS